VGCMPRQLVSENVRVIKYLTGIQSYRHARRSTSQPRCVRSNKHCTVIVDLNDSTADC